MDTLQQHPTVRSPYVELAELAKDTSGQQEVERWQSFYRRGAQGSVPDAAKPALKP